MCYLHCLINITWILLVEKERFPVRATCNDRNKMFFLARRSPINRHRPVFGTLAVNAGNATAVGIRRRSNGCCSGTNLAGRLLVSELVFASGEVYSGQFSPAKTTLFLRRITGSRPLLKNGHLQGQLLGSFLSHRLRFVNCC